MDICDCQSGIHEPTLDFLKILAISPKDTYVVNTSVTILIIWLTITNETVRPDPVDVLDCAPGLLQHHVAGTGIVRACRTVRHGKISSSLVAVEEHGDVEYLTWLIFVILMQRQLAIRGNI